MAPTALRSERSGRSGRGGVHMWLDHPCTCALYCRTQGKLWAMHVLEGPISWIMSTCYIAATVWSTTPLITVVTAALGTPLPSPGDNAPASHFMLK